MPCEGHKHRTMLAVCYSCNLQRTNTLTLVTKALRGGCFTVWFCDHSSDCPQVNYINAHATSTLVGDVAELKAVKKVFTDTRHLKMNATKSMIGHCLGAAGGMEAVATIKAITTGWLHPTINHVRPA